jgi:hypothetical protein
MYILDLFIPPFNNVGNVLVTISSTRLYVGIATTYIYYTFAHLNVLKKRISLWTLTPISGSLNVINAMYNKCNKYNYFFERTEGSTSRETSVSLV